MPLLFRWLRTNADGIPTERPRDTHLRNYRILNAFRLFRPLASLVFTTFHTMMTRWRQFLVAVGGDRAILALGVINLAFASVRLLLGITGGVPLVEGLIDVLIIGGAGSALLYFGKRLPQTSIHREVYPRIVAWSLGGIVGLLGLNPSGTIDEPIQVGGIAIAVGSVGGYAIGMKEAQAITRARKAEQNERQLEQQNDRLESFAGMLAHELRNPLTIAQIYHPQEQPQNEGAATHVENALDRIEEMVDILLVTVRGSEADIDYERVAVAEIVDDAWDDLSVRTEAADLAVEATQTIRADPVHVEHLFRNLFRNSIEHGGEDVTIRVGDLTDGFYLEDDGPGIPEDAREDVREAGFTSKADGIGLGLTFIDQLAKTYDWDWTITEAEVGGARFEFTGVDLTTSERGSTGTKTDSRVH